MKTTRPNTKIKTKIVEFDNIQEMVTYIKNTPATNKFKLFGLESEKTTNPEWYGTKNIKEAYELLRSGWVDKSKELEQKLNSRIQKEAAPVMHQRSVYDVVGGNCSVPRYLQGVPTSMIRQVRQPVKEKVVTVNFCCSFAARVKAEEITERAIDCLSYVKKLEDTGTRVNVNVVWATTKPNERFAWVVPVKKSSERLSIAKLAFTLCHPSMLRRIMFCCLERDTDVPENFVTGYGTPAYKETLDEMFPNITFFNASR